MFHRNIRAWLSYNEQNGGGIILYSYLVLLIHIFIVLENAVMLYYGYGGEITLVVLCIAIIMSLLCNLCSHI